MLLTMETYINNSLILILIAYIGVASPWLVMLHGEQLQYSNMATIWSNQNKKSPGKSPEVSLYYGDAVHSKVYVGIE